MLKSKNFLEKETDMIDFLEDTYKIIYKYLVERNLSRHKNIELNFWLYRRNTQICFAAEYISKKAKIWFS